MFQPSLQTHFNAPVPLDTLLDIRGFGFRWCRVDAQTCDTPTLVGMVEDCEQCDLVPLPIVYDLDRLRGVPKGLAAEWGNEPDGDILPSTYRENLERACALALEIGVSLWGPAISNLDRDSLGWMQLVRGSGWPDGLAGITAHRYGDGTFDYAHPGFSSRDDEIDALLELCDGLPYMITEFGYPTYPAALLGTRRPKRTRYLRAELQLSEAQQAENIGLEWQLWERRGCQVPFLYQVNDGIHADEGYGIRRCLSDGTLTDWKQAAYEVPQGEDMAELAPVSDNTVFATEDLVDVPGRPGEFGVRCPPGADTLLSPKTSGNHELRGMDALGGPDETCRIVGKLLYFWQNSQGGRFAWRLAE